MKKIFLDTNIVLDLIEKREGLMCARRILEFASDTGNRLYVSALSMANAAYVVRRRPAAEVKQCLGECMDYLNVLPMNDMQIYEAVRSGTSPDFEDNLQIICAEYGGCDLIISHNVAHFRSHTDIPVLSPQEFVSHCCVES